MVIAVICNDLSDGRLSATNSHRDLAAQGLLKAEAVWKPTESSPDMGANRSLGVFESRLGDFVNWPR